MFASFLITFREALEAALIIGIIAAYLAKIGRKDLYRYIYTGITGALIASLGVAFAFKFVYGALDGTAEELFEGFASLLAAAVLTYMIFWMADNSKNIKGELHGKIDMSISKGQMIGLTLMSFIAVFREGVETVLFLGTLAISSPLDTIAGFVLGLALVLVLSAIMFKGMYRLDISKFFKYTSVFLIIFAAGLTAYGVHELNEAAVIPSVIEHVWDVNPALNADGTYPALHEKGIIGIVFKSLVGYNGNPSLTEVIAYFGYWIVIGMFVYRTYRLPKEVQTHGSRYAED